MSRYANILNDDAFKVIIFTPGNEKLMARMLEVLLPGKIISKLEFRPTEQHGLAVSDKISNFDAVCTSKSGEQFIVEMQGLRQDSYADRMLCYASFPIRMQLEQKLKDLQEGRARPMDYSLLPMYLVSFVNFTIKHSDMSILQDGLVSSYRICSPKTGEIMTEALYFAYLELGRLDVPFGKPELCRTLTEQLAYSMKYMSELTECPREFSDSLFPMLFEASAYANMDTKTQMQVTRIMRTEIDRIAENEYARKEGVEQGIEQARHSDVVNLLAFGMSPEDISKALKIPLEKVASIAKKK
jgi:predicted transposase/invertase (TIGR01784 family)